MLSKCVLSNATKIRKRGDKINALTFRFINFCRGSYHKSRTSPDGTATQRNVLSVYGLRACETNAKIDKKSY